MILRINNHADWLKARQNQGIGGSEAGCVLGVNKYQSNVELWELKTGRREAPDLSNNSAVQFGKFAEPHLRELFRQDYPEYQVDYHEFWIYVNDQYPFIFATLDGELTALDGSRGILEIKTTTIQNKLQWDEWDGRIPDSYYAQCLHQLAATGWDFVILKAYIRYHVDGEVRVTIRHYRIDRKDVKSEINYLIARENKFWQDVQNDICPNLILPAI
ncbi:YqaJ viral recombinase family protein [Ruminococcus flavefaciens]|uniref:YqaJ viral recombinase family protein n=1 Tax=Ruminococcus flavefaciens TaxID=1265 RepID=UPI0026EC4058|nr:YqaJ viral recombinase family protein [Ruminococcus flavefaciens]